MEMSVKIGEIPYKERIQKGIADDFMRRAVSSAQGRLRNGRLSQAEALGNWEDWRQLGSEIRTHTLENLDYYLQQLSEQVARRGGNVFLQKQQKKQMSMLKV